MFINMASHTTQQMKKIKIFIHEKVLKKDCYKKQNKRHGTFNVSFIRCEYEKVVLGSTLRTINMELSVGKSMKMLV